MAVEGSNIKKDLVIRLRKIEGQIKGVIKMVEQGRDCEEVLTQIASLRAALNKIGILILENHLKLCINEATKKKRNLEELEEFLEVFSRFIK